MEPAGMTTTGFPSPVPGSRGTAARAMALNFYQALPANRLFTTYSGRAIDLAAFSALDADIQDIARGLSNLCRFCGQGPFYSVAQHSLLVAGLCAEFGADPLEGLLHDASEAYLGDISRPLKRLLPDYRGIEARVQSAIACKFGIPADASPLLRLADDMVLELEIWRVLGRSPRVPVNRLHSLAGAMILDPLPPREARRQFLASYHAYSGLAARTQRIGVEADPSEAVSAAACARPNSALGRRPKAGLVHSGKLTEAHRYRPRAARPSPSQEQP